MTDPKLLIALNDLAHRFYAIARQCEQAGADTDALRRQIQQEQAKVEAQSVPFEPLEEVSDE